MTNRINTAKPEEQINPTGNEHCVKVFEGLRTFASSLLDGPAHVGFSRVRNETPDALHSSST